MRNLSELSNETSSLKILRNVALGLLILTSFQVFAAETVYVQSVKAALRAGSQNNSALLSELTRGTELEVLSKAGLWLQVKHNNKLTGWINKLQVNSYKPVGNAELSKSLDSKSVEKMSRQRPKGNVETVASVRGLSASQINERKRGNESLYFEDLDALDKIDKRMISDQDIEKFVKSANLHP